MRVTNTLLMFKKKLNILKLYCLTTMDPVRIDKVVQDSTKLPSSLVSIVCEYHVLCGFLFKKIQAWSVRDDECDVEDINIIPPIEFDIMTRVDMCMLQSYNVMQSVQDNHLLRGTAYQWKILSVDDILLNDIPINCVMTDIIDSKINEQERYGVTHTYGQKYYYIFIPYMLELSHLTPTYM
jgi:hypothetical protein